MRIMIIIYIVIICGKLFFFLLISSVDFKLEDIREFKGKNRE